MNEISINRLHLLFRLDPDTGKVYRRIQRGFEQAGNEAGTAQSAGYRQISIDGRRYLTHRIIFAMTHGRWPIAVIDHINGDITDNRPENLREATHSQNSQNRCVGSRNSSGVKGVRWDKTVEKWHAYIEVNSSTMNLGYHNDLELAELIVSDARSKYHGTFARSA